MSHNPFDDRSTPIILRARDMRQEAYEEQHLEAISLLDAHGRITGEGRVLLRMAKATLNRARNEWARVLDGHHPSEMPAQQWEKEADELDWAMDDAVAVIESNTPDGWDYGTDPDDPSYGGFYPIDEEDDQ